MVKEKYKLKVICECCKLESNSIVIENGVIFCFFCYNNLNKFGKNRISRNRRKIKVVTK